MTTIFEALNRYISVLPTFGLRNLFEVLIISFVVYELLVLLKNTRAWNLLKGLVVILIFYIVASAFGLTNIIWLLQKIAPTAVIALVVIFQPELRKVLDQIGRQALMERFFPAENALGSKVMSNESIDQIIKAVYEMAKKKTGALIVIEKKDTLEDCIQTGIQIDGIISSGLLINIFEKNTPLHDGAVVVRGNKVVAATCYLPLSGNNTISKEYGTRHRAALGISEATDSLTVVVSEESGYVSVAGEGQLLRVPDAEGLRKILRDARQINNRGNHIFRRGGKKNEA